MKKINMSKQKQRKTLTSLCSQLPPLKSAYLVRFRGLAVQFFTVDPGLIYDVVLDDAATRFATSWDAAECARKHGLKIGEYKIFPLPLRPSISAPLRLKRPSPLQSPFNARTQGRKGARKPKAITPRNNNHASA